MFDGTVPEGSLLDITAFRVRHAEPADSDFMAETAALVNIHSYSEFNRGFLFYSLSSEEYRERILSENVVRIFEWKGEPIGFLCGITAPDVRSRVDDSEIFRKAEINASALGFEDYFFIDQFAILPEFQNRGYGEVFALIFSQTERMPIYADMLEAPLRNPRIGYWHRRGFVKVDEVVESPSPRFLAEESSGSFYETLTWGLYLLPQGRFDPQRTRDSGSEC